MHLAYTVLGFAILAMIAGILIPVAVLLSVRYNSLREDKGLSLQRACLQILFDISVVLAGLYTCYLVGKGFVGMDPPL